MDKVLLSLLFLCQILCNIETKLIHSKKSGDSIKKKFEQCDKDLKLPQNCSSELMFGYCLQCHGNTKSYIIQCFVDNNTQLNYVFQNATISETEILQIVLNNTWEGYFPLQAEAINLTFVSRLSSLVAFSILPCYPHFHETFPLAYGRNTFEKLNHLLNLTINVPLQGQSLMDIVRHLPKLQVLDLSFTREMSMCNMTKTLKYVNNNSLKMLFLTKFQDIGDNGYNNTLDINVFLSNRIFPNLTQLTLNENSLARITPGISALAPNLRYFIVTGNALLDSHNVGMIAEALMHPTIEVLDIGFQGFIFGGTYRLKDTTHYRIRNYSRPHRTERLKRRVPRLVQNIPNQKQEGKGMIWSCINQHSKLNGRSNVSALFNFTTVQEQQNMMLRILQCILPMYFVPGPPSSVLPPLRDIFNHSCKFNLMLPIGKNLRLFYADYLHWEVNDMRGIKLQNGTFCFRENNVTHIIFKNNAHFVRGSVLDYTINNMKVSGFENLKILDFEDNNLSISADLFINRSRFPNLFLLYLDGNDISLPTDTEFCKQQPNLKALNLGSNNFGYRMKHLPYNMVRNCSQLVHFSLENNALTSKNLEDLDLNGTKNLRNLTLSGNKFTTLSTTFMRKLQHISNSTKKPLFVDLSKNPLKCGCKGIEFITWLTKQHNSLKFQNFEKYICFGVSNTIKNVSQINKTHIAKFQHDCFPPYWPIVMYTFIATISLVMLLVLCIMLFKNRWKIKYQLFRFQQLFDKDQNTSFNTGKAWKYDAYVCYCSLDRFWVHDMLLNQLERNYSFKLCLRMRDFLAGGPIAQTIIEHIGESREVIVVMSDLSLSREWWSFELEHSRIQLERRGKRLIVIKLGDLHNIAENQLAAHVLDAHGFLEWGEDSSDVTRSKYFWEKLVKKIYRSMSDRRNTADTE